MVMSKQYSDYLKLYIEVCAKTDVLVKPRHGFTDEIRKLDVTDILKNYEYFEGMSRRIFELF